MAHIILELKTRPKIGNVLSTVHNTSQLEYYALIVMFHGSVCTCTVDAGVYGQLVVCVDHCYCHSMQEDQAHILRAPMPGVVKKIQCEEGDSVAEGTIIVTLEAMKMQNPLFAPMTGIVSGGREGGRGGRGMVYPLYVAVVHEQKEERASYHLSFATYYR